MGTIVCQPYVSKLGWPNHHTQTAQIFKGPSGKGSQNDRQPCGQWTAGITDKYFVRWTSKVRVTWVDIRARIFRILTIHKASCQKMLCKLTLHITKHLVGTSKMGFCLSAYQRVWFSLQCLTVWFVESEDWPVACWQKGSFPSSTPSQTCYPVS